MYRTNSIHVNIVCVVFIGFFIYFFWHKKGKKLFDNNFSFTIFVFLINSCVCQTCIKRSTPRCRLAIPKYWSYLPVVSVLSSLKIAFYVRSLDIKNVWYAMFFFYFFLIDSWTRHQRCVKTLKSQLWEWNGTPMSRLGQWDSFQLYCVVFSFLLSRFLF